MVERDDALYDRVVAAEREAALANQREHQLEEKVKVLEGEMSDIKDMVSRGRGVLLAVLTIGSIVGAIIGGWGTIARFFGGHP